MNTDTLGQPTQFQELKPGDVFYTSAEAEGARECALCIKTDSPLRVVVFQPGHLPALNYLRDGLPALKISDVRVIPVLGGMTISPRQSSDLFADGNTWRMLIDGRSIDLRSGQLLDTLPSYDCLTIGRWKLVALFGCDSEEMIYEHPAV
jgi:hypothetical protein